MQTLICFKLIIVIVNTKKTTSGNDDQTVFNENKVETKVILSIRTFSTIVKKYIILSLFLLIYK